MLYLVLYTVYQPEGRSCHTSNIVGNHLYVWSGSQRGLPSSHNDKSKRKFTSCVEIMNLDTGKWKQAATTGNPPLGVTGYSSVVIENSILYFGGYCNHVGCYHYSVKCLNIDSFEWKKLFPTNPHTYGPMMKSECGMIPVKIDGKNYLLVIGGSSPSVNTPQQQNAQYVNGRTNEQHYFDLSTSKYINLFYEYSPIFNPELFLSLLHMRKLFKMYCVNVHMCNNNYCICY